MRLSKRPLANRAIEILSKRLPQGWHVAWRAESQQPPLRLDGELEIAASNHERVAFGTKLKGRELEPRDVLGISTHLRRAYPAGPWLVISPFIGARSRELLAEESLSFIDLTGNISIASDRPALIIALHGDDKSPLRSPKPRTSFRGAVTGRVIRFLCAHRPPYGVRDIASRTHTNPGYISRILDLADRESLLARDSQGRVTDVSWKDLIRYWSRDLAKERVEQAALEPHGLSAILARLQATSLRYAITGPKAATFFASAAPAIRIDIYVDDFDTAKASLDLHAPAQIGNVRLLHAYDDVVFEGTTLQDDLVLCNPVQIAADLATLRGRSQDEYDAFIAWMEQHESDWLR